jgi:hypothetical protein
MEVGPVFTSCQYNECSAHANLSRRVHANLSRRVHANLRLCMRCMLVSYCSRRCQREDWVIHREVCHTSLSRRLEGMYRVMLEHGRGRPINISGCMKEVSVGSREHNVSAFGKWAVSPKCALCEREVDYEGPFRDVMVEFSRGSVEIEYYRCVACYTGKKVICTESFMETGLCGRTRSCGMDRRRSSLLFIGIAHILPAEIIREILLLFISLPPCPCPT